MIFIRSIIYYMIPGFIGSLTDFKKPSSYFYQSLKQSLRIGPKSTKKKRKTTTITRKKKEKQQKIKNNNK